MGLFNFLEDSNNNNKIIYVLEYLLYIKINGETIKKRRHIDLDLYNILTAPDVYQKIIHEGCLPITNQNAKVPVEFMTFINNLQMYITFDLKSDSVWSQIAENPQAQEDVIEKVTNIRKELIQYIFDKQLITEEIYTNELNHKVVKPLFC